jgi:hypothetical protein
VTRREEKAMKGYEVFANDDDEPLGKVVDADQDFLIVEHKHLLKEHHYAIPTAFAHAEAEHVVRLSVARELVEAAPEIKDGELDRRAIAIHYGLVEEPSDIDPDDPDSTEEMDERRLGLEPSGERRARALRHEESSGPRGRQIIPSDSHEGP